MPRDIYEKIKLGISEALTLRGVEALQAIDTRPHPTKPGMVQIIDGEHRWKILKELGVDKMPCDVTDYSDLEARARTSELNWNRGDPDPDKYPQYLVGILRDFDVDIEYLAERLPESKDEIQELIDGYDIGDPEEIVFIDDDVTTTPDASDVERWVELRYFVSSKQAEIIERALSGIASRLQGKNLKGRALEFMAVLALQTPDEEAPAFAPYNNKPVPEGFLQGPAEKTSSVSKKLVNGKRKRKA